MKFCIALPFENPLEYTAIAKSADSAGFGGLVLADHLFYPTTLRSRYPYRKTGLPRWAPETPFPDPWIAATAMASVTTNIVFISSVYVVTLRHPLIAAKEIASAAVFTGNRIVFGVGAGWMQEEFDAVNESFPGRGRRMDEQIEVMQKLWSGKAVAHRGEHYQFEELLISPAPSRPIPIWGGGRAPVSMRRAAQQTDGWIAEMETLDGITAKVAALHALRADSSRAGKPFSICAAIKDAFDLDGYRRAAEVGMTHFVTQPWRFYGPIKDLKQKLDAIQRFGDEIIAPLEQE